LWNETVSWQREGRIKRIIEFQLEVDKLPNNRKITDFKNSSKISYLWKEMNARNGFVSYQSIRKTEEVCTILSKYDINIPCNLNVRQFQKALVTRGTLKQQ
jgi:hypothetical protein